MKFLVFLFVLLLPIYTYADEYKCTGDIMKDVQQYKKELNNCKIVYGDNPSTADMNNATYSATDCTIDVAYKLFSKYYSQNETETKEIFDRLVKNIYDYSHNLYQDIDMGKEIRIGTMYNTMAIGHAYDIIKKIVKSYINEIEIECSGI